MARFKLTLEYDGSAFVGWQRQKNGFSVQACLEDAVQAFTGEQALVQGAGRTDSGVHALGQVAHVDIEKAVDSNRVREALNFHVRPAPVTVLTAAAVADDFHARFSATERLYLYRILNRRAHPALERGRVWHVRVPLDPDAMHAAAQILVGTHDFSSFRATECQADSPVRTLDALTVARYGEEIEITARAPSFLHHQVRNIVGTLVLVGEGKWTAHRVSKALAARDRKAGGPTAPPQGLYLTDVLYGDKA